MFFNVCLHSCSFPLHTDWQKFDSPVDGVPQGNWRWNSSSRDVVASSPSFSRPSTRAPWGACSQATDCIVTICVWYWVQVIEHSSDSICIQSEEPVTKGPGAGKMCHDNEVLLYKGYFTITGVKNIVCYTKDFVMWRFIVFRFHCILSQGFFFKQSKGIQQTILCL